MIELKADMVDGTTSIWKGTIDSPKKKFGAIYQLDVIGSHYQSLLLDITVTETYNEQTADTIFKDILLKYLTDFTNTGIETSSESLILNWSNKPFYDCVLDLCNVVGYDAYIDSNKKVYFFERESVLNEEEVIKWDENIREMKNFGTDQIDIKNRIIIYGEDSSGIPIIYQVDDTSSQTINGVKEKIVKDSSIKTYEQAVLFGDGLLLQEKDAANKGEILTSIMPRIKPGDLIWITHPVFGIEDTYRIVKYTHFFPLLTTNVIIAKEKTIPTIFKDASKADLAKENITNPFKMTGSLNLTFDSVSDYDATASTDITISESKLKISSGSYGAMVSKRRTSVTDITKVHLKIDGDSLSGTTYFVSAVDGATWESINLEEETTLASPGTNLRLKIVMTNENTLIDSVGVLYR